MSSAPSSTSCRRSARGMARWSGSMSRVEPSWWPKPGLAATPRTEPGSTHGVYTQLAAEPGSTHGGHRQLAALVARAVRDQPPVASGQRSGDCSDDRLLTGYV